ncbi:hypothetical protein ACWDRB_54180 [Nonomuraea sp. NPDC003707]
MNGMAKLATVLATTATSVFIATSGSTAHADSEPLIDVIDDIIPNASLLPNMAVSPTVICIPQNTQSLHGDGSSQTNNQSCTQNAQQSTTSPGNALRDYEVVVGPENTLGPNSINSFAVQCPAGKVVLGGGYTVNSGSFGSTEDIIQLRDAPSTSGTAWEFRLVNRTSSPITFTLRATCARPA